MAFYNELELQALGFKSLGKNVLVSKKASIFNHDLISIGDNSRIDDFCVLSGKITIGQNVHIAVFCNLAGGTEGIEMHDFSGLAYGVNVFSQSDDYTGQSLTNPTIPEEFKNVYRKKVVIEKHVIVGTQSLIFPGVTLQVGGAVGAMALVNKTTEPWMIYAGVPAKPVKERSKNLLELEQQYLKSISGL